MSDWLESAIAELLKVNKGQLSGGEYRRVADAVIGRGENRDGNTNFLVFGTGRDSPLWRRVNEGGRTVFLESSSTWLENARQSSPGIEAYQVTYATRRSQWRDLLEGPPEALLLSLSPEIQGIPWDVILVDAPAGFADSNPGRMQSIYTASVLARQNTAADVFVHDCQREVERVYCDRFLAPFSDLIDAFDHMRHYRSR